MHQGHDDKRQRAPVAYTEMRVSMLALRIYEGIANAIKTEGQSAATKEGSIRAVVTKLERALEEAANTFPPLVPPLYERTVKISLHIDQPRETSIGPRYPVFVYLDGDTGDAIELQIPNPTPQRFISDVDQAIHDAALCTRRIFSQDSPEFNAQRYATVVDSATKQLRVRSLGKLVESLPSISAKDILQGTQTAPFRCGGFSFWHFPDIKRVEIIYAEGMGYTLSTETFVPQFYRMLKPHEAGPILSWLETGVSRVNSSDGA